MTFTKFGEKIGKDGFTDRSLVLGPKKNNNACGSGLRSYRQDFPSNAAKFSTEKRTAGKLIAPITKNTAQEKAVIVV